MNILKSKIDQSKVIIFFLRLILTYLMLISCSNYSPKLHIYLNEFPQEKIDFEYYQSNLDQKFLLDLSKNQLLPLISEDFKVAISLDLEGKIIGYRTSKSRMPTYWNSEFIKKSLKKNNFFSLSFKRDQIVSFKLLCLN